MKKNVLIRCALLSLTAFIAFSCQNKERMPPREKTDESMSSLTPQVNMVKYTEMEGDGTSSCTARPGTSMGEKEYYMQKRMPTDKTPTVNGQPFQPASPPPEKRPTSALIEEDQATAQMIEEESVIAEIEVFANNEGVI